MSTWGETSSTMSGRTPDQSISPPLNFSNLEFCGRKKEMAILKYAYAHAALEKKGPSAVYIQGAAGCGKSCLLNQFRADVEKEYTCFTGSGKYEEGMQASQPYEALLHAMNQLLTQIQQTADRGTWKERLTDALDSDKLIAERFLPRLKELDLPPNLDMTSEPGKEDDLDDDVEKDVADGGSDDKPKRTIFDNREKDYGFERLKFVFRAILRTISADIPVLLALDDLQWSDRDSLELLRSLLEDDQQGRMIVFVLLSRPVPDNDPMAILWEESTILDKTKFALENLELCDTRTLVSNIVGRDDEETNLLADVVIRMTSGNAFFTIHFLRHLQDEGLITYSTDEERWSWDTSLILSETNVTDNVFKMLGKKLESLNDHYRAALITAAFLQVSRFDVQTIIHSMRNEDTECEEEGEGDVYASWRDVSEKSLLKVFQDCSKIGLLEALNPGEFKFAHDRVREAIYNQVPDEERVDLHLRIGRFLRNWLDDLNEIGTFFDPTIVFRAANQYNRSSRLLTDQWEKIDVVDLNYQAAEHALERCSFYPALEFLQAGLTHMADDPWQRHYDTKWKHSVALTRVLYCCGQLDESVNVADEIIAETKTFAEKRVAYHTKILCLVQLGKSSEALQLGLSALKELGHSLPKRFMLLHLLKEIEVTKKLVKQFSNDDLTLIPRTGTDEHGQDYFELIERIGELALHGACPSEHYFPLVLTFCTKIPLELGLGQFVPIALAAWAGLLIEIGDINGAYENAKIGVALGERNMKLPQDGRAVCAGSCWALAWKDPVCSCVERAGRAMQFLRDQGALEYCIQDYPDYLYSHIASGISLDHLAQDCRKYMELLSDLKQSTHYSIFAPFCQAVANLQAKNGWNVQLSGEYMNDNESFTSWSESGNERAVHNYYVYSTMVAYYFGDVTRATEFAAKMWGAESEPQTQSIPYRHFLHGMIALDNQNYNSKNYRHRKCHRKRVRTSLARLKSWVRDGATNCEPLLLLLQAEKMTLTTPKNTAKIKVAFEEAIFASAKVKFVHHEALANERMALFLLTSPVNDESGARRYLKNSRRLYGEWGAYAKVSKMEGDHLHLLADDTVSRPFSSRWKQQQPEGSTAFFSSTDLQHHHR